MVPAMLADAVDTVCGALCGTSTVGSYVEASASMARSILGTSPSRVSRLPRAQAPYKVSMVSNISTRQKASAVVPIRSASSA